MQQDLRILATKYARDFDLPPDLVIAICQTESSGDPFASRFEPDYPYLWDNQLNRPLANVSAGSKLVPVPGFKALAGVTPHTEWVHQKTSWGLMQVMGGVARARGWTGPLPALCSALTGLEIGCNHLAHLRDRFLDGYGWAGVVAAYNAGNPRSKTGEAYAYKVAENGAGWLFS